MEEVSNCCGAKVEGLNADNIGRCSECGEGCGVEEVYEEVCEFCGGGEGCHYLDCEEPIIEEISKLSEEKK